jgi:hypothetical protein
MKLYTARFDYISPNNGEPQKGIIIPLVADSFADAHIRGQHFLSTLIGCGTTVFADTLRVTEDPMALAPVVTDDRFAKIEDEQQAPYLAKLAADPEAAMEPLAMVGQYRGGKEIR